MRQGRDKSKLVAPCLNLVASLIWVFIALRNFDRLSFLGVYHRSGHGGLPLHADGVLPAVAGMLFGVSAVLGFLRQREQEAQPAITTLFGSKPL